jgi:CubicO group peptidase (beta-lactamase class C family)
MKKIVRIGLVLGAALVAVGLAGALGKQLAARATLFPGPQAVPSASDSAPSPHYAAAIERARELVRAAIVEQKLPGVSVAVGAGGSLVWAEGFGWRDIVTKAPVIPRTRFNIGTAASLVMPAVAQMALADTGTDSPAEWSPGHVGEPEEDFPGFTFIREGIFRPLGLADPARALPGDRATFYVPLSGDDPGRGRRLMYMRDLACCADEMTFYSTPSDLVRFALATDPGNVDGELAGGPVMSLLADRDIVVAVTSNIAFANTASLAERIRGVFEP